MKTNSTFLIVIVCLLTAVISLGRPPHIQLEQPNSLRSTHSNLFSKSPSPKLVIDLAQTYGVKAGNFDNTRALLKLNADFAGAGKGLILLDFQNCGKGEILYSDNSWLHGIDSFIVSAKGITFKCTSDSPWDVAKAPLYNGGIYGSGRQPGAGSSNAGVMFNTVAKGAREISFVETWMFSKGDAVYLAGYEEQFYGEPVNPRFFEWKTIESVSKGSIRFTEPLQWSYNAQWKDVDMPGFGLFGKPRIFRIPSTYTSYAKFIGCTFAAGTNVKQGIPGYFIFKARELICDGCTIEENWPTETWKALFVNCVIGGSDLDKNVGICEYNSCKTGGIFAATGVDSLRLINNIISNYSPLSPRILYAEGNSFTAPKEHCLQPHPEATWVEKVYLKNNRFTGINNPHVQYGWTAYHFKTTGFADSELFVADADNYVAKGLGQNSVIESFDGTTATVKDIIHNGTQWVIQLTKIKGQLKKNQKWRYNHKQKVIDLGGNKSLNGKKIF